MSARIPPGVATMDDIIEACALLHPVALQSVKRGWPVEVERWLRSIQAAAIAKQALADLTRPAPAVQVLEHPDAATSSGGMGVTPMERSGTDPAFSGRRHVGTLDASAAVRLPPRPHAP